MTGPRLQRDEDIRLLRAIVAECAEAERPGWAQIEARPFRDMLDRLESKKQIDLTDKQRSWARSVYERAFDVPQYENLASSGKLVRGREVVSIPSTMPKPLKPPKRKDPDE